MVFIKYERSVHLRTYLSTTLPVDYYNICLYTTSYYSLRFLRIALEYLDRTLESITVAYQSDLPLFERGELHGEE
jgi:hypothetical protein